MPAPECGRVVNNKVTPELKQVKNPLIALDISCGFGGFWKFSGGSLMSAGMLSQNPPCYQALLDLHNNLRARVARGEEGIQVKMSNHCHPPPNQNYHSDASRGHRICSSLCGAKSLRELHKPGRTSVTASFSKTRLESLILSYFLIMGFGLWVTDVGILVAAHTNSQICTYCCKLEMRAI